MHLWLILHMLLSLDNHLIKNKDEKFILKERKTNLVDFQFKTKVII